MAATTLDRNTPRRDGLQTPFKVAAGELIPAGVMVCVNAAGFLVNASTAPDLIYIGRSDARVDNTTGADGDIAVQVEHRRLFAWDNDGTVDQTFIGKPVYIADNHTVSATDAGGATAGTCFMVNDLGVWTLA
ncbi:hypothetical protein [Enterobacter ludwigii]